MNKNSILAVLSMAMVGCAHQPASLGLSAPVTNSQAQVDVRPLGEVLNVKQGAFNVIGEANLEYVLDDSFRRYIAAGIQAKAPVNVELLFMTVNTYTTFSTFKTTCNVAYNVNGIGRSGRYEYLVEHDLFSPSRTDTARFTVTPCLDRLSHDITVYADSL
ncbi:hypothetical protein ACF8PD_18200 [Vibrio plantisponsor]|uniref:hypothetical protein n=1 Tax=Vibrio plantisponsor TaxID=664643 RepID=UPI00370C9C5E